ncbi:MAG TPA: NADH-quinone oxidoreductase subunit C [Chryseosolibacter sp.]
MQTFEQLLVLVKQSCSQGDPEADVEMTPKGVRIDAADLASVCRNLRENPLAFFDMLSCITVIDNGPDAGTMDLVYNLYSIPFNHHLAIKIKVAYSRLEADSVTEIWKTANWHEREAYDMFGIRFTGHPDLRRILLPADWEGYPLRKDYQHQEYYRDVKVAY